MSSNTLNALFSRNSRKYSNGKTADASILTTAPRFEDALARGTLRASAHTSCFQKLESLAYIFVADSMGPSLFKFVQWAPKELKRRIFSASECDLAVQGHPRSMILVPIESACATSY